MKVMIVTTSPRKSFSTSMYFSNILKLFFPGQQVDIISLKSQVDYNLVIQKLDTIDTLVFATPVYVDSLPSTTLNYLDKMEKHIAQGKYSFPVYAMTNCGFYEGHQCSLALNTYALWCSRAGLHWCGGIGVGSGVMLGFIRVLPLIGVVMTALEILIHAVILLLKGDFSVQMLFSGFFPMNLLIQTVLWLLFSMGVFIHLFKLRTSIVKNKEHGLKFTTAWFCPRFLFVIMGTLYWILRALLLHGVMPWKLFYNKIHK